MQTLETPPYEAICSISLNPLDTRKPRGRKTKNSMCFCCGTRLSLSDHHLKPRSEGGTDQPDNLVTVCYDCHDEIEGPADGAWERVVQFKNKIKDGRVAKTKQQRALELREGKNREAEYEKSLRDNKNRILQAMGVLQAEPVAVPGVPELRATRRAQGFLDRADGRLYYSLTHGEEMARLLFDAPLEEYVQSIGARVSSPMEYTPIMCPCDCGREIASKIEVKEEQVLITPISPENLAKLTAQVQLTPHSRIG